MIRIDKEVVMAYADLMQSKVDAGTFLERKDRGSGLFGQ
jgi:hypothetical protein